VLKASACSSLVENIIVVDILDLTPKVGSASEFSIAQASSVKVANANSVFNNENAFTATLAVILTTITFFDYTHMIMRY